MVQIRALVIGAVVVLAVVVGGVAFAQRTGGSMGGGSFGSRHHSYSSSSHRSSYSSHRSSYSSRSSRYSGSSSSSGYSRPSGGGGAPSGGLIFWGVFGGVFLISLVMKVRDFVGSSEPAYIAPSGPVLASIDVSAIYIAVDARARAKLQKRFTEIAGVCDTTTTDGLVKMLREVALELRRARDSWLYVGAMNARPMAAPAAEEAFQKQVQSARAGFEDEIIRATDGRVVRGDTPDMTALTEEGDGLVLITLVVAANGELYDVRDIHDPDQVRRALEGLSALSAFRLVAVEVIWTPAAENDRMSSVELEAHYPFMVKAPEALAGKVVCKFCGGGFPAELLSCPHCGGVIDQAA